MNPKNSKGDIPYKGNSIRIHQTVSKLHNIQGVNTTDDKYRWQTSDSVKPFETGLPLISESALSHQFVDPLEVDRQIKKFNNEVIDDFYSEDIRELMRESEEEIENYTGATSDVSEFTKLYQRLNRKHQKIANKPFTGISKTQKADNLIDTIGKLSLKSVQNPEEVYDDEAPFPVLPRRLPKQYRPTLAETQLVKTEMKRVFKPSVTPFTDIDDESDFPMTQFGISRKPSRIVFPKQFGDEEEDFDDGQSLLIDIRDEDIFWTKDCAPFTRKEVGLMKKFREQCRSFSEQQNRKTEEIMQIRDRAITRTFQSRKAFDKEIELVEAEKKRVMNLPPGKGEPHQLSWVIASKEANRDRASLIYRKKAWNQFAHRVSANGRLKTPSEIAIVEEFRRLLVQGVAVNKKCFYQTLKVLSTNDYTLLGTALIIEILRDVCGVPSDEFMQWLKDHNYATELVAAAPECIQRIRRTKIRKMMQDEEKQNQTKLMRGETPQSTLMRGLPSFKKQPSHPVKRYMHKTI